VVATCGNGTVDDYEDCDDGNDVNTDTCTNKCIDPVCGDGIVTPIGENLTNDGDDDLFDTDDEECDDANDDPTDSCTNDCKWNVCGDGVRYVTASDSGSPNQNLEDCDATWYRRADTFGAFTLDGDGSYGNWDSGPGINRSFALNGAVRNDLYTDGPGVCSSVCEIQCFPSQNVNESGLKGAGPRDWAGPWKNDTYCLFAVEPYGDATIEAFDNVTDSWEAAQDYCEGYGLNANLASVTDVSGEDANQIISDFGSAADGADGLDDIEDLFDSRFWIGLRDVHTTQADPPGMWIWWPDGPNVSNNNGNWAPAVSAIGQNKQPDDGDNVPSTPGQQDCGASIVEPPAIACDFDNSDLDPAGPDAPCVADSPEGVCIEGDICSEEIAGRPTARWYDEDCRKDYRFFCEFPLDQDP
jgi:cysteine-rich repeat protein